MRIRQVKPEFWSDAKMYGLPLEYKLVFIGLWNEADDSGWLKWDLDQIAVDLFRDMPPDEAIALLKRAGKALSGRKRLRILKCGHAQIPRLPHHQRLAGPTKQVHTFFTEHSERCATNRARPRGFPRDPARLGQVRLGQVSSNARARTNGVAPSEVPKLQRLARSRDTVLARHAQDRLEKAGIPWE